MSSRFSPVADSGAPAFLFRGRRGLDFLDEWLSERSGFTLQHAERVGVISTEIDAGVESLGRIALLRTGALASHEWKASNRGDQGVAPRWLADGGE